ncbi:hypothetical protein LSH36_302g03016 [Paralvinella palmiformis]|uniref:Sulfotransferase n=1 Tax=Paralvinella palmiformis TaxID=53620 RepID=A0AAD9JJD4_9ANNE|nr:hypothetical protein LSH36_302g03016 [Paralvinella palmiformis]
MNRQVNTSSVTKVLFLTYFRSGSSLLAESVNKNPEAFYWFEPLMATYADLNIRHPFVMLQNGSFGRLQRGLVQQLCEILVDVLNCKLRRLDDRTLGNNVLVYWQTMEALVPYKTCLIRNGAIQSIDPVVPKTTIDKCLPLAIDQCKKAKIRGVKTIRIASYMVDKLVELDPEIKIIHSVRDPRGMLLSVMKIREALRDPEEIRQWVKMYCYRMHNDKEFMPKLKNKCDVLHLRYEDLVTGFNQSLHRIYSYMKRDVPPTVLRWFATNTHAAEDTGPMGTARTNATAVAFKWRQYLPMDKKAIVKDVCSDVLRENRYLA